MNQIDMFGAEGFAPPSAVILAPEPESDWARQRRLLAALPLWPDKPRQWFSWGRNKKRVACECTVGEETFFVVSNGGECFFTHDIDIGANAERVSAPTTREDYAERQLRKLIGEARLDERPYFHIVEHFEPRYIGCDTCDHPHLIANCAPILFGSGCVEYHRRAKFSPEKLKELERQNDFINAVFCNSTATLNERLRHEKLSSWQHSVILEVLRRQA